MDVQQRLLRHTAARLCDASMVNDVRAVRQLLAGMSNPNSCDESGRLPLYAAAFAGSVEVVRELLAARADANIQEEDREGGLPLQVAAFQGHVEVARVLLQRSASPNGPDRSGWTALCSAACQGHTSVVRLLLDSRAEPSRPAHVASRRITPLQAAQEAHHVKAAAVIRAALPAQSAGTNGALHDLRRSGSARWWSSSCFRWCGSICNSGGHRKALAR